VASPNVQERPLPLRTSGPLLLAAFGIAAAIVGVGLVDDAYIFLRYARHVFEGLGPVFNPGERVEGYTSPLWLALLVPLFALRSDPSGLTLMLGGLVGFATVLLVAWRRPLPNALLLATHPAFVFWSFSGLETPLTALLLLITFVLMVQEPLNWRRLLFAGIAFGLSVLTRAECLLFAPLIAARIVAFNWPDVRRMARHVMVVGVPGLVLIAGLAWWRQSYYGEWLPNTYYAKADVDLRLLLEHGAFYLLKVAVGLFPVAVLIAVTTGPYQRTMFVMAIGWAILMVRLGGDFFPYFRFAVPLLPIVAYGLGSLRMPVVHGSIRRRAPAWALPALVVVANLITTLGPERVAAQWELRQAEAWSLTGRWLDANLPPQATMASLVVGGISYYGKRPTIDLLGLTDGHIARQGDTYPDALIGHQRHDSAYVLSRQPDVIVLPSSGLFTTWKQPERYWPEYGPDQLRQAFALANLVSLPETRARYEYRTDRLPDGTYVDALWLRDGVGTRSR
jgi:arabinofuranosyltransferase